MKEKVFESLFVNIDINGKGITFGTIYRTPKANHSEFYENLEGTLKECTKMNKKVILMGDMNYDMLNTKNKHINSCVDKFFEFGMYPIINVPTRFSKSSATVLDHFGLILLTCL